MRPRCDLWARVLTAACDATCLRFRPGVSMKLWSPSPVGSTPEPMSRAGATYLDLRVTERDAAGGLGPVEPEPEEVVPTDPQAPVESGATLNP